MFTISSRDDQAALKLSLLDNDYFSAELRSRGLSAVARVGSYQTTGLGEFFKGFARDWRGWSGTRQWASLEDELEIRAECDRTGHTYLEVTLRDGSPPRWVARAHLVIEAGQLDALAAAAVSFEQSIAPAG